MVEGRFFNPSFSTDSTAYMINDVAAGVMKNKNPVGSTITLDGRKGTIIGVFKDFHSIDLAGPIVPTIMQIKPDDRPIILVKYSSGSFPAITGEIKAVYQHYEPEAPFKATLFRDLIPYSNLSLPSKLVGLAFHYCSSAGLYGIVWTRFFYFRKPYQRNWDKKGQWGNNFICYASVAYQLYQMADHRLFYCFACCFASGKKLSGKVLFPRSYPTLGIFSRAGHCLCRSTSNG